MVLALNLLISVDVKSCFLQICIRKGIAVSNLYRFILAILFITPVVSQAGDLACHYQVKGKSYVLVLPLYNLSLLTQKKADAFALGEGRSFLIHEETPRFGYPSERKLILSAVLSSTGGNDQMNYFSGISQDRKQVTGWLNNRSPLDNITTVTETFGRFQLNRENVSHCVCEGDSNDNCGFPQGTKQINARENRW